MRGRHLTIVLVCVTQAASVVLGTAWGLGAPPGVRRLDGHWLLAGSLAAALLGVEALRFLSDRRLRATRPFLPWLCASFGLYAVWIMFTEPFMWYIGDATFINGILLLLPFLLALSPFVRAGAVLGATGAVIFFATSLAMLTRNGLTRSGGYGFFGAWIS